MTFNPKTLDAIRRVNEQIAAKQSRIAARNLSARLCVTYAIPENPSFIPYFTSDPKVKTVHEAIAIWLSAQMADVQAAETPHADAIFGKLLQNKLNTIWEDYLCA